MAHQRPAEGRPYRRAKALIRRTQGICWLCGQPINDNLRSPHPMSRTVDHKTPVALGGAHNDPANMRAAHRVCNQKRGTGRKQPTRQSRPW